MPSIQFTKAHFITSCAEERFFPRLFLGRDPLPEVAFIGRSNAGKSSLINHLTQKKHLVYVSSTPGKTQLINFFSIDERLLLVDLPGYGFAKISAKQKEQWGDTLSHYLEHRPQLKLLVLLLDVRRELSKEDILMISWAKAHDKQLLFVLSKADKLSTAEKKEAEKRLIASLSALDVPSPISYVLYSIYEGAARAQLQQMISSYIYE